MNMTKPPFNDLRMRKAVALATDREKMIAIAAEGWGVLGGYIGPHTPYALSLDELKQFPQFSDDMAKRQAEAKRLVQKPDMPEGWTSNWSCAVAQCTNVGRCHAKMT